MSELWLYGWECPCGEYYNPEVLDYCGECGLYRGETDRYKITGYWKKMDADLRRLVRNGDLEADVHACMTGSEKDLAHKVAEIGGDARHMLSNIFTLRCKVKHLKDIAKLGETYFIEGPKTYHLSGE